MYKSSSEKLANSIYLIIESNMKISMMSLRFYYVIPYAVLAYTHISIPMMTDASISIASKVYHVLLYPSITWNLCPETVETLSQKLLLLSSR